MVMYLLKFDTQMMEGGLVDCLELCYLLRVGWLSWPVKDHERVDNDLMLAELEVRKVV